MLYWIGNSAVPPETGTVAVFPVMTIFACSVTGGSTGVVGSGFWQPMNNTAHAANAATAARRNVKWGVVITNKYLIATIVLLKLPILKGKTK